MTFIDSTLYSHFTWHLILVVVFHGYCEFIGIIWWNIAILAVASLFLDKWINK